MSINYSKWFIDAVALTWATGQFENEIYSISIINYIDLLIYGGPGDLNGAWLQKLQHFQ